MFKKIFSKKHPEITWEQEKEIVLLEGTIEVVTQACESLRFAYHESLVSLLHEDYGYIVNTENTELYYKSLSIIENDVKGLLIKIDQLKQRYYGK